MASASAQRSRQGRARGGVALALWLLAFCTPSTALAERVGSLHWAGQCQGAPSCFAKLGRSHGGVELLVGWHDAESKFRVGALLPPQIGPRQPVTIWLDHQASIYLRTESCTERYCEAMVHGDHTNQVLGLFKSARGGVISYPVDGQLRVSELSLMGFTDTVVGMVQKLSVQSRQ